MRPHEFSQIEFVGGPLDGHVNELSLPFESLVLVETIPVRDKWFAPLLRLLGRTNNKSFALAVYELHFRNHQPFYSYIHSRVCCQQLVQDEKLWYVCDFDDERRSK